MSKGYYQYKGNTYYSLYDRHDNWKGHVNAKDVKISSSKGGSYCSNKQSVIYYNKIKRLSVITRIK